MPLPYYDQTSFPYLLSRNKFKIELIDTKNKRVETLVNCSNQSGISSKLAVVSQNDKMEIYFIGVSADQIPALRLLTMSDYLLK